MPSNARKSGPATVAGVEQSVAATLRVLAIFDGLDDAALGALAEKLRPTAYKAGARLMAQGDAPRAFVLITEGEVEVRRTDIATSRKVARLGPGSIVGELGLLGDRPRSADVVAATDVAGYTGGPDALRELVTNAQVHERILRTAAGRVAQNVEPVSLVSRRGVRVRLSPLVPSDRPALMTVFHELSPRSRYLRFFHMMNSNEDLIDELVDVDYVNDFGWIATDLDDPAEPAIGSASYVRHDDEPTTASIAITVVDAYHGRGIGRLLLGALIVAATESGVEYFVADLLSDNSAARGLLDRLDVSWQDDSGILHTRFALHGRADFFADAEPVEALRRAARGVREITQCRSDSDS